MKRQIVFLLAFALLSVQIKAALIKGLVKDAQTGEELIGASVYLKERPASGVITGLDGTFVLKDIPEDKDYTLVCSYISYQTMERSIRPREEYVVLEMIPSSVELDGVVFVAAADKSTDNNARALEKNSPIVLNVVSAKSMEISPDLNVANVLQRVSGVTMERNSSGDGQYAILRGMDKRYNYTLVNGVKIPSPDNKNRYVPLDIFPSELLDRLEVTKSLTADMEGDATGGAVNMVMKDAPDRFILQANLSTGYNTLFTDRDYAYFDRGGLTPVAPREAFGADYSAKVTDFGKGTSTIAYKTPLPNLVGGLSVGNRFFDRRFGIVLAGSYQNRYKGVESLFFTDNMNQTESTVRLTKQKNRNYSEEQMQYGIHAKMDYRFDDNHKLEWYNAYIGTRNSQVRESVDTDLSLGYAPEKGNVLQSLETRSRFIKQQIFATTLQGLHTLSEQFFMDWSAVYSDAKNKRPDNTYINLENQRVNFVDKITADNAERRWEHNSDRDLAAYVNLKYQRKFSFAGLEVKAGGMYRDKDRANTFVSYFFNQTGTRPEQGKDFVSLDQINWNLSTAKGSVGPLDYDAGENIGAAYLMGKLDNTLGHLIVGLRAEHTDQSYFLYYPNSGDDPRGRQVYWDLLPSVHLKYVPMENMNIRASYFRSVNRPGFFEIVPYSIINEDYTEYGNKNLKRARIDNIDLRWEMFPRPTEQFMVGLFYKKIQDPIEQAYYSVNNRQYGYGPANLGNAENFGVEVDVIKYMRNFGIKANYTYTHSSITTGKVLFQKDEAGKVKLINVDQTRPLTGQAPHVCNISLLYKDTKYGWDAQLATAYTGKKIVIASRFLDSDYWEEGAFTLDLSAEKRFNNGLSVFFKANNLLNTASRQYIPTTNAYNAKFEKQNIAGGKTLIREDHYGQNFLLGVRFKM